MAVVIFLLVREMSQPLDGKAPRVGSAPSPTTPHEKRTSLSFNSNASAYEYAVKHMSNELAPEKAVLGIVTKVFADDGGRPMVAVQLADKSRTTVFCYLVWKAPQSVQQLSIMPPHIAQDTVVAGDLVLFYIYEHDPDSDSAAGGGWVGNVLAVLRPELDLIQGSWMMAYRMF